MVVGRWIGWCCVLPPHLAVVYLNLISNHSRVNKFVTAGRCWVNRLIFGYNCVLLAPSGQGLQHARDQTGLKTSTRKTGGIISLQKHKSLSLESKSRNTTVVETCKYLGMVYTSDGSQESRKETNSRICKIDTYCMSVDAPWSHNGRIQTPQSCEFINHSLFRSSHMVMNLG